MYVDRLNGGVIDTRKLGMSDCYIDNFLPRYIPDQQLPKHNNAFAQHRSPQRKYPLEGDSNPAGDGLLGDPVRARHEGKKLMTSAPMVQDKKDNSSSKKAPKLPVIVSPLPTIQKIEPGT